MLSASWVFFWRCSGGCFNRGDNAGKQALGTSAAKALFVSERFDRVEPRGKVSGNQRGKRADEEGADANNRDVPWNDFRRDC